MVNAAERNLILAFDRRADCADITQSLRIIPELHASASRQFSAVELQEILAAIPVDHADIWIVDLRQESHGFINGEPIGWVGYKNAGNEGKSVAQIKIEEERLLNWVGKHDTIAVYYIDKLPHGIMLPAYPKIIEPYLVQSEEQLAHSLGVQYKRFYVMDHNRPDDIEVDAFVSFIQQSVKPRNWLHFHCRGGKGRSSTFVAMLDIIRNAQHHTFEQIVQRQVKMGNIKLDAIPSAPDKVWKSATMQERYEFLHKFYAYVVDPRGYKEVQWSKWLEKYGL